MLAACKRSTRGPMQHALGSGQAWLRFRFDLRVSSKGTQAYSSGWALERSSPRTLPACGPAR